MDAFREIEQALQADGPQAALDLLAQRFREQRNYAGLFDARLMKKRHELGLPLLHVDSIEEVPETARREYEQAFIESARETGGLFLADGDIARAWSYFRAIGEPAPVAEAIERLPPDQSADRIIEIAFHERVNPRKGFELILGTYGVCRAISFFDQYPTRQGREESLALLVRTLHAELLENLQRAIAATEGSAPETQEIPALLQGRAWLFEGDAYYVDTSHVVSVLRFCLDARDRRTIQLAAEMAEYGTHLSAMYQYRGDPPFEDVFADHGMYLRALLGQEVEAAVAHFRRKIAESDPDRAGSAPAQALVALLVRLARYQDALETALEHLRDADPAQLACPSALQLCQLAGDPRRLMELARERDDLLGFTAGALQV